MKQDNESEDMRLRAQTANENWKQDGRTLNGNDMQSVFVLYMTQWMYEVCFLSF